MNVSTRLSEDDLEALVPALLPLAKAVRRKGVPAPEEIEQILLGLDGAEESMAPELMRWAKILNGTRGTADEEVILNTREVLMMRGVPEAQAILAVDTAAEHKTNAVHQVPSPEIILPVQETASPIFYTVEVVNGTDALHNEAKRPVAALKADVRVVGFGTLRPDESQKRTVRVEGGPGRAYSDSERVDVQPRQFGSGPVDLTVFVRGSGDSSLLAAPLLLENDRETLELDVIAEWKSLSLNLPDSAIIVDTPPVMPARVPFVPFVPPLPLDVPANVSPVRPVIHTVPTPPVKTQKKSEAQEPSPGGSAAPRPPSRPRMRPLFEPIKDEI